MRITPAHAGKRLLTTSKLIPARDHPRTCGEKMDGVKKGTLALGSPPHMRGKGKVFFGADLSSGITPAHAGKRGLLFCFIRSM